MSQDPAAFRFQSWLRRGAAAQIQTKEFSSGLAPRVTVPATVRFQSGQQAAPPALTLQGPGDVVGFDARAIVRIWPPPETRDAEPNYFPLVELDQVDLPWRYTPRKNTDSGRVRPWICLLALKETEFEYLPPAAGRALGTVKIPQGKPMPPIDQAWAWAHVQVSGDDGVAVGEVVRKEPGRCVARLLCPRRLEAKTTYWGVLVPVFEVGRRAGLRLALGEAAAALGPAWSTNAEGKLKAPVELPVYHRWRFGTGEGGDFESLIGLLKPRALADTVGTRDLDVSKAGGGLPPAATDPAGTAVAMRLGGALRGPNTSFGTGPDAAFVTALAERLNVPAKVKAEGGPPVVAPPLYGAWHARRGKLEPGTQPPWFQELNADPRSRVAAALGTQVVQAKQQALMASAWEQVAGIREANDQLRRAQLSRAIGERLHRRFLQAADADAVLVLTARAHGHVRHQTKTVRALAQRSPTRLGVLSGALRRLARPLGPLGRRQGRPILPTAPLVSRVNDGTYDAVLSAAPPASTKLPTHGWLGKLPGLALWKGPPTAAEILQAPPRPLEIVWEPPDDKDKPKVPTDPNGQDSPSMALFRQAALAVAVRDIAPAAGETLRRLDLSGIRTGLVAAFDPKLAIPAALGARFARATGFVWNPADPIEPVMAHPVFPQAMVQALAELSPDWVLPGLSEVPANTVTAALTNQAFIEGYLVGLNHEMARELLWNEYPTDQRGSYFRQFWDPAGRGPTPVPETAKDILPLNEWQTALGTHSPRLGPDDAKLVLMVRGEVLRRYPGTLVYASRAIVGSDGKPALPENPQAEQHLTPIFAGRLRPDVSFFGFALTEAQAKGGGSDPGYFFVFEEQPGEPRFGLDVDLDVDGDGVTESPASWVQVAWTHLVANANGGPVVDYIDLEDNCPRLRPLESPGSPAWHMTAKASGMPVARGTDHAYITYQLPVRVAVHASEILH